MDRRNFLALLTGAAALPGSTWAEQAVIAPPSASAKDAGVQPYLTVGPFPEDAQKVFFFFLFSCPYCSEHWRAIQSWGETLPKTIRLVPMPVVTADAATIAAAAGYYAVKQSAPEKLSTYVAMAYNRSRGAFVTPDTYHQILRELNVVRSAGNKEAILGQLNRISSLMRRYKTDATPHFGVCGKYATNSNFTNGDYRMLGQMLNALVSQHLGASS